jgi:hypothetical protein
LKMPARRDILRLFGDRAVAQLGSALEWGSRGRGFESRRPDIARRNLLASNKIRLLKQVAVMAVLVTDTEGRW